MVLHPGDVVWTSFWKPEGEWCEVIEVRYPLPDFMSERGVRVTVGGVRRELIDQNWFHREVRLPAAFTRERGGAGRGGWQTTPPGLSWGSASAKAQTQTSDLQPSRRETPSGAGDRGHSKSTDENRSAMPGAAQARQLIA